MRMEPRQRWPRSPVIRGLMPPPCRRLAALTGYAIGGGALRRLSMSPGLVTDQLPAGGIILLRWAYRGRTPPTFVTAWFTRSICSARAEPRRCRSRSKPMKIRSLSTPAPLADRFRNYEASTHGGPVEGRTAFVDTAPSR